MSDRLFARMGKNDPTKLTSTEHTVLSTIIDVGEAHGLAIVAASNGALLRTSIYVLLSRLEDRGFVESRYQDTVPGEQGPRRRLYKVTGIGQRALRAWEAAQAAWNGVAT